MGCTSSKERQVSTKPRTEETAGCPKLITDKRTKNPGLFGYETVEKVSATVDGGLQVVDLIGNGAQSHQTCGQALHQFSRDSSVRFTLQKLIFENAVADQHGHSAGFDGVDLKTRRMRYGPYIMPCMVLGVSEGDGSTFRFTWAWAHKCWDEKRDALVQRLQLVGQTLRNTDLTSDAFVVDSQNHDDLGATLVHDAAIAANKLLGWLPWYAMRHSDGSVYLVLGRADEAKLPLPAAAVRKARPSDLQHYFDKLRGLSTPADFNDGVVGLAEAEGWRYETTSDGWAVSEHGPRGERFTFRLDGTNAAGEPQYEHTLHAVRPTETEGQICARYVEYVIKSREEASTSAETPPGVRRTDCKQLCAFASDTFLYSTLQSAHWMSQAVAVLGVKDSGSLSITLDGANRLKLVNIAKPETALQVPCELVVNVNKKTGILEWAWSDPSKGSPSTSQIRSAGEDLQNADLCTPVLAVEPGVTLESAANAAALAAAKAMDLHVFSTIVWSNDEFSVFLLRTDEVKEVSMDDFRPATVYHHFSDVWPRLRRMYDFEEGAKGLAARSRWTFTHLYAPLPGWVLHSPASDSTFTFQDDHIRRETGSDYNIALDVGMVTEISGAPMRLNVHLDNSPREESTATARRLDHAPLRLDNLP